MLRPLIDTPFNGGPATWIEDFDLELQRYGFVEECHFTVGYSPVPDETAPRGIGGVLATVHEITEKVIGERRVGILRDLGARVAETRTDVEACISATNILAQHPEGRALRNPLSSRRGWAPAETGEPHRHRRGSRRARVHRSRERTGDVRWPLAEALRSETAQTLERTRKACRRSPLAHRPMCPTTVTVVPIMSNIAHRPAGALVVGISPRLRLDKLYASFLELVGSQIAAAVANARAYEEERRRADGAGGNRPRQDRLLLECQP